MPFLNINSSLVAFSDDCAKNSQPLKRNFDWTTKINGYPVLQPESKPYSISPGVTANLFSGTRTLSTGSDTAFDLTLNPVQDGVYRLTWTAGTAPVFRTDRSLTLSTETVTVTVNNNSTAVFSLASSAPDDFASVSVGDSVWIPDTSTGDSASVFNPLNVGLWVVIAKGSVMSVSNKSLTLKRPSGEAFQGATEVVTVTADSQFQAFSSGPVQIDDSLEITAGFSSVTWGTYTITQVNPSWVEFTSTNPIPLESDIITGASGIAIYTEAKQFLRLESDQLIVVRVNGDTNSYLKVAPRVAGDADSVGYMEIWGPIWQLDVVNLSPGDVAHLQLITAN